MLDGSPNRMMKKISKVSGLSILEAIVSTVIVGIGFIAILQMTNFSVQSIDNSGDRTKANFLTEMMVEDVLGSRDSFWGLARMMKTYHMIAKGVPLILIVILQIRTGFYIHLLSVLMRLHGIQTLLQTVPVIMVNQQVMFIMIKK